MVIELQRTYLDNWTEGMILLQDILLCRSIELRWAQNKRAVSCISEGVYPLALIKHKRFGECLRVDEVEGRSGILIHPANDARKELRGCIAPVFSLTGEGRGQYSRLALSYIVENLKRSQDREHYLKIVSSKTQPVSLNREELM